MCENKIITIKKKLKLIDVINYWLKQIDKMDYLTRVEIEGDYAFAFDIAYLLFPLMESISFNLLGKSVRSYLKLLGLSPKDADILVIVFRNGLIHNSQYYEIKYDDGIVNWAIMSSGGTSGIRPYDVGYQDDNCPEYNIPAERVFDYEFIGDKSFATLYLDRLIALVKHDLVIRKDNVGNEEISFIIGQRLSGKKPKH